MDTISLTIEGMSCAHCAVRVRTALESAPGVEVEELGPGSARIRLGGGAPEPEALAAAVSEAGYPTRVDIS